ncbi:MAG: peptide-methionine (S)-S-oxide reductase MsrA [Gammaproteobacteria bacterium]|nr:peptide-methionine (S)-S-oxide reductase MsrA [Gammaproteobacteria bacterium]
MKQSSIILIICLVGFSLTSQAQTVAYEQAILAGGCFWCVEADFEALEGVVDVVSGYSGGKISNPTYRQVTAGGTGHLEAVQVTYDPSVISYAEILDHYWRHIDPTRDDGQFCDRGPEYRPAIFYQGARQKTMAEHSRVTLERTKPFPDAIKVELIPASTFYPAEDYHQDFYDNNPLRYWFYRFGCGRDRRIAELWGDA